MRNIRMIGFLSALAFCLIACGTNQSPNNTGGPSNTPNATPNGTTPSPTTNKPSGTPTPGQVTLTLDKSHYATNETIKVTILNGLSKTIYTTDHQTSCTMLQLQIQVNGNWLPYGRCYSMRPTRIVQLSPGSQTLQLLPPSSNTPKPAASVSWPAGTYRVVFVYNMGPNEGSVRGAVAQSEPFNIS